MTFYTNPIHFTTICFIRFFFFFPQFNSSTDVKHNVGVIQKFSQPPRGLRFIGADKNPDYMLYIVNVIYMYWEPHDWYHKAFNPLRTKTTLYLFLRGNKSLLYHQIGNRNFFIFITIQWNLMFCQLLCRQDKIWTFGNPFQSKKLPICTRIVIFNLCICCQFEDSQIILPKINSYEPSQHSTMTNEGSFFAVYFSLSFGT